MGKKNQGYFGAQLPQSQTIWGSKSALSSPNFIAFAITTNTDSASQIIRKSSGLTLTHVTDCLALITHITHPRLAAKADIVRNRVGN